MSDNLAEKAWNKNADEHPDFVTMETYLYKFNDLDQVKRLNIERHFLGCESCLRKINSLAHR